MLSFQLLSHLLRQAFTCTHTHSSYCVSCARTHFLSPTLRLTACVSLSHKHTHRKLKSLLSVQLWAVFPSPWPFPAQTMLCVPQRKLSSRLWGPAWPSATPPPLQTPERPPEPPHHNLLRCQEEHLCDSGEETLPKFSHWERESCLYSSVCECLSQCACLRQRSCEHKFLGPGSIPVQIINGVREKTECVARPGQFQSMNHVSQQPGCQP